jgi:Protein of unknown function (DUF1329)
MSLLFMDLLRIPKLTGDSMKRISAALLCALLLSALTAGMVKAQVNFDADAYRQLADASSATNVPAGTEITAANWQQYKQFMPIGMQAGFSGQYDWKIGAGPDFTMEVGPATHLPLPAKLRENTEKYAGQARLKNLIEGGYTLENYGAGIPFPNPSGPDKVYQIFFNTWTYLFPAKSQFTSRARFVDRFRNSFIQDTYVVQYRLSHISEAGYPDNPDYGKGFLQASRYVVLSPEQTKYTTQLAMLPDDPAKLQEIYVYVPSLRRSMRLSSAARCSPILGSDFNQDDNGDGMFLQPTNFEMKLLGTKKVLAIMNGDAAGYYDIANYNVKDFAGWPKPAVGNWEVRDAYVVDITPLPNISDYCYGHKVAFIDKETFAQLYFDNYDSAGKLWKSEAIWYRPLTLNSGEKYWYRAHNTETMLDFQNNHATVSMVTQPKLGKDCPGDCQQVETYAFPSGLSSIMK